jgi:hypothetical protein
MKGFLNFFSSQPASKASQPASKASQPASKPLLPIELAQQKMLTLLADKLNKSEKNKINRFVFDPTHKAQDANAFMESLLTLLFRYTLIIEPYQVLSLNINCLSPTLLDDFLKVVSDSLLEILNHSKIEKPNSHLPLDPLISMISSTLSNDKGLTAYRNAFNKRLSETDFLVKLGEKKESLKLRYSIESDFAEAGPGAENAGNASGKLMIVFREFLLPAIGHMALKGTNPIERALTGHPKKCAFFGYMCSDDADRFLKERGLEENKIYGLIRLIASRPCPSINLETGQTNSHIPATYYGKKFLQAPPL